MVGVAPVPTSPHEQDAAAALLGLSPGDLAHPETLAALAQLKLHLAIVERAPLPELPASEPS